MTGDLSKADVNRIISMLHDSLEDAIKGIDVLLEESKEFEPEKVQELRGHLMSKLGKEDADTEKLKKLMGLIATEGAVIEILKEDAEEWIKLIDAIEEHVRNAKGSGSSTAKDLKELEALSTKIKGLIRS